MYTVIYRVKVNGNWIIKHLKPMTQAEAEVVAEAYANMGADVKVKKVA